ncbi:MAG: rhodanese-like domain-containing protein [Acidobacteria bacterium]|nr:rhodanese-like domain-containing protein [Acidobacteriota bacterium]
MVTKVLFFSAIILAGSIVSSCEASKTNTSVSNSAAKQATPSASPPAGPSQPQIDNAARISLADAKKAFDDGSAIFIDTRADSTYKLEHIKGSINIPAGTVDANMSKLSKGKKLIAYCS